MPKESSLIRSATYASSKRSNDLQSSGTKTGSTSLHAETCITRISDNDSVLEKTCTGDLFDTLIYAIKTMN